MKEYTTVMTESDQKFKFSIRNDWLIVRSNEELDRLRIEEKKAKKRRFFQSHGRSKDAFRFQNNHDDYDADPLTTECEEDVLLPDEEIYFDHPDAE